MFNKLGLLLVSMLLLCSGAIYASGEGDVQLMKNKLHDSSLCLVAAKSAGMRYGVDFDLLQTISAVESGTWNKLHQAYIAWPWTVNVNGRGYYYQTRDEAVAAVKNFMSRGYKSIDVGCMQINLKYHGEAFSSIEEAMDPFENVKYSARFLRYLYVRNGNNWEKAAQKYHSANDSFGSRYKKRLQHRFETYKLAGLSQGSQLF